MEWADALIWKAVLSMTSLEQDGRIKERLLHFHATQWAYGQILRGRPLEIPELSDFPDLRSIGLRTRRFYRDVPAYIDGLTEAELTQKVEFPWAEQVAKRLGSAGPATVGDSLLQVVLHTTYHRGQVATRLRESGGEPPLTDFIAWIWVGRPALDCGGPEDTERSSRQGGGTRSHS